MIFLIFTINGVQNQATLITLMGNFVDVNNFIVIAIDQGVSSAHNFVLNFSIISNAYVTVYS